jgi:cyclin H
MYIVETTATIMHYQEISQVVKWQLSSQNELNSLRLCANKRAREWLAQTRDNTESSDGVAGDTTEPLLEVAGFAAMKPKCEIHDDTIDESSPSYGPTQDSSSRPLLNPTDEALLLSFYASKIPHLIGPHASLPRCIRQPKVAATASLLFKRFYLSNSVMIYDPKSMSVASAFLAAKVEDCMLDIRYLELATKEMNAPVLMEEILKAEVHLLKGCDFDLLMFHPYKTVLACTEDLRVYLKSEKGRQLAVVDDGDGAAAKRLVAGEDLRPMHDMAIKICDDVIVSDIPLMYGPGEVGLAALMVANEDICNEPVSTSDENGEGMSLPRYTKIDMIGYIKSRFQDSTNEQVKVDSVAIESIVSRVTTLGTLIRESREGKHGCGNHNVDMEALKGVHKKLKKCRAWGQSGEKKKKKKRKAEES